jgi:hypothetical protein
MIIGTDTEQNDTGLYELYTNVVDKYVSEIINEANRYAEYKVTYRARKDAKAGAIIQLKDNTPAVQPDGKIDNNIDDVEVTEGVSYSYGDIDTPEQFEAVVNQANVTNWRDYTNGHKPGLHTYELAYWARGKRDPAEFNIKEWPRKNVWPEPGNVIKIAYSHTLLGPDQWGGIDCNGLIQRALNEADGKAKSMGIGASANILKLNIVKDKQPRSYYDKVSVAYKMKISDIKYIHKGDVAQYGGHIAFIHSSGYGFSGMADELEAKYDLIHSFGNNRYDHDGQKNTDSLFSRRVIVTGDNIGTPNHFIRIKLWQ